MHGRTLNDVIPRENHRRQQFSTWLDRCTRWSLALPRKQTDFLAVVKLVIDFARNADRNIE